MGYSVSDAAFDLFTEISGNDKVSYLYHLKKNNFRFDLEPQPEAWVQELILDRHSDKNISLAPMIIFECIRDIFGSRTICRDTSECYGINITIKHALIIQLEILQSKKTYDYAIETSILSVIHLLIAYDA